VETAIDVFSGTSRVAFALKQQGLRVHANDSMTYAWVLARAMIAADSRDYPTGLVQPLLDQLNVLPPVDGWFTERFCRESLYFRPENGSRIDAIRAAIDDAEDEGLRAILLASLMLAADKVDSTTGVQMAYLKGWAPRASNCLELKLPPILPGEGRATQEDALTLKASADLAYLDPPYNQHSYLGNYHVWETLVLNDRPEAYGIAQKRIDCRSRKSPFNSKATACNALETVIDNLDCRYLLISFSDEGFISRDQMEEMLAKRGPVQCFERPHRRYVGALIGIHNARGERVGRVSHVRNREYLFLVGEP
jgi:adenine-specific DNA-methyltransferase